MFKVDDADKIVMAKDTIEAVKQQYTPVPGPYEYPIYVESLVYAAQDMVAMCEKYRKALVEIAEDESCDLRGDPTKWSNSIAKEALGFPLGISNEEQKK